MAFVERFRDTRVAACYLHGVGSEKIVLRGVGDINQLEKNGDVVAQARAITAV
ncbi:hypothetical protein WN943_025175 [Citrus x changshan-huyou]